MQLLIIDLNVPYHRSCLVLCGHRFSNDGSECQPSCLIGLVISPAASLITSTSGRCLITLAMNLKLLFIRSRCRRRVILFCVCFRLSRFVHIIWLTACASTVHTRIACQTKSKVAIDRPCFLIHEIHHIPSIVFTHASILAMCPRSAVDRTVEVPRGLVALNLCSQQRCR